MEEIPLIEIECNHCHQPFTLCQSCYHGNRYCSDRCKTTAQRKSHREAQRKYRKTAKGQETHRKAERRRRLSKIKKKEKTMADEGTSPPYCCTKLRTRLSKREPRCHFCGAYGVVVSHFPFRGYGSP